MARLPVLVLALGAALAAAAASGEPAEIGGHDAAGWRAEASAHAAEAAAEEFEDGARREGVPPGWLRE